MGAVRHGSSERGGSTLELMVAAAFAATLTAQTAVWTRTALGALRERDAAATWERSAWLGLESMATDIRNAGFQAAGDPLLGLAAASPDTLLLLSDLDGDGTSDGPSERIGYVFDAAAYTLRRATGHAAPQLLVDPMPGVVLTIGYFGAAGVPLIPGAAGLSAAQRAAVGRIDLAFVDSTTGRVRARTSVLLRNRP